MKQVITLFKNQPALTAIILTTVLIGAIAIDLNSNDIGQKISKLKSEYQKKSELKEVQKQNQQLTELLNEVNSERSQLLRESQEVFEKDKELQARLEELNKDL